MSALKATREVFPRPRPGVYLSLYSLKTETQPVSARSACTLYEVDDENPDPMVIQGHRITHEPNPNWTQPYQVDATLK